MTTAWHEGFDDETDKTERQEPEAVTTQAPEEKEETNEAQQVRVGHASTESAKENKSELQQAGDEKLQVKQATFEQLRKEFFSRLQRTWANTDKMLDGADNMTIMGKSLVYWKDYFTVDIPQSPSMRELHECMSLTNSLITTVNHKLSVSQLTRDAVEREVKSLKARKFVSIKRGNGAGRAPSNDMASMQVDLSIVEHLDQLMVTEYVVGFWENKRQALISTRKTLEAMMFGLSSEMKMKNSVPDHEASNQESSWPSY